MAFNSAYQTEQNGPLKPAFRQRIETAKNRLNLTLADVGQEMGFSGAFVSTLLNASNPGRVRSKHIERMATALEAMEIKAGIRVATAGPAAGNSSGGTSGSAANDGPPLTEQQLIRAAHKLGYEISFRPLHG